MTDGKDVDRLLDDQLKFFDDIDKMVQEPTTTKQLTKESKGTLKLTSSKSTSSLNFNQFSTKSSFDQTTKTKTKQTSKLVMKAPDKISSSKHVKNQNKADQSNNNEKLSNNNSGILSESIISKQTSKNDKMSESVNLKKKTAQNSKISLKSSKNANKTSPVSPQDKSSSKPKRKRDDTVFLKLYDDGVQRKENLEMELDILNNTLIFPHQPEITKLARDLKMNPKEFDDRLYPKDKILQKQRQLKKRKNSSLNRSFNRSQTSNKSNKSSSFLATSHVQKLQLSLSKKDFYKKFKADSKSKGSIEEIFHPVLSKNSLLIAARKGSSFERLTSRIQKHKLAKTTRNSLNNSLSNLSAITLPSKISNYKGVNLGHKLYEQAKKSHSKKKAEILKKKQEDEREHLNYSYTPNFSLAHLRSKETNKHKPKTPIFKRQEVWEQGRISRLEKMRNSLIEREEESFNHFQPKLITLELSDDEEFILKNKSQIVDHVRRQIKARKKQREREESYEKAFGYGKNYNPKPTKIREFNLSKNYEKKPAELQNSINLEELRKSRKSYKTLNFFGDELELDMDNSVFYDYEQFYTKASFFSKKKVQFEQSQAHKNTSLRKSASNQRTTEAKSKVKNSPSKSVKIAKKSSDNNQKKPELMNRNLSSPKKKESNQERLNNDKLIPKKSPPKTRVTANTSKEKSLKKSSLSKKQEQKKSPDSEKRRTKSKPKRVVNPYEQCFCKKRKMHNHLKKGVTNEFEEEMDFSSTMRSSQKGGGLIKNMSQTKQTQDSKLDYKQKETKKSLNLSLSSTNFFSKSKK